MRAAPAGAVGSGSGRKAEIMAPVMAAPAARGKRNLGRGKDGLASRGRRGDVRGMTNVHARFESELQVRPDDIDLFQHVHSSRYLDYVLAARYDQMARCYGMPWESFTERGLGWYMASVTMNYRRPLKLGDRFVVRTWIEKIDDDGARVAYEIERKETGKRCVDGHAEYKLVNLATARAVPIPDDIKARYSI